MGVDMNSDSEWLKDFLTTVHDDKGRLVQFPSSSSTLTGRRRTFLQDRDYALGITKPRYPVPAKLSDCLLYDAITLQILSEKD